MLRTKIQLERTSGGIIPPGAIVAYQLKTLPTSKKVGIVFYIYYDKESLLSGRPSLTNDVLKFKIDNDQKNGCEAIIDDSILSGVNPMTLINITDTIALSFIEDKFLGSGSCEKIGDSLE